MLSIADRQTQIFKRLAYAVFFTNKTIVIAVIIGIVLAVASPYFLTSQNLLNVSRQIVVNAIVALAFTLVLGMGEIDLSVGGMLGLIGVIAGKLMVDLELPVYAAIIVAVCSGVLLGALNATVISSFILPPFIVTLATASIFRGVLFIITNMVPVTLLPKDFLFIGQGYIGPIPVQVYVLVIFFALIFVIANRTKIGRYAVAIGANREAARVSGINLDRVRLGIYSLVGLCVAVAAVIQTARSSSAQTGAGLYMELDIIAAVVIGGTALYGGRVNVVGTLFGVLIIGMVNNGLNLLGINPHYQIIAKGLIILFALILDRIGVVLRERRVVLSA